MIIKIKKMRYLFVLFMFAATALGAQDCVIEVNTAGGDVYLGTSQIKYAVENGGTAVVVREGRASRVQSTNTVDVLVDRCNSSLFKFTDSRSGRSYAISKSYILTALEAADATLVLVTTDPGVSFKTVESAASLSALLIACGDAIAWPENNTYYVSEGGDNSTAVKNDPSKPWRDPWAAAAAVTGTNAQVIVYPGYYDNCPTCLSTSTQSFWPVDSIQWTLSAGVVIDVKPGGVADLAVPADYTGNKLFAMIGPGVIDGTDGFDLVASSSNVEVTTAQHDYTIDVWALDTVGFLTRGGVKNINIRANRMSTTGSYPFYLHGGTNYKNIDHLNYRIDIDDITSTDAPVQLIRMGGYTNAKVDVKFGNLDFVSDGNGNSGGAIWTHTILDNGFDNADSVHVSFDIGRLKHRKETPGYADPTAVPVFLFSGEYFSNQQVDQFSLEVNIGQYDGEAALMNKPFKYTTADQVVKFDIGDATMRSGAPLWSDLNSETENGYNVISLNCEYCVSDTLLIYSGVHTGSTVSVFTELTISGTYETEGLGPVVLIGSDPDTTVSKILFKDARLKSAGTTSLAGVDVNSDVWVAGLFDDDNKADGNINIHRLYEYGVAAAVVADGYTADDLAAGTAAYSVLTGDFILNFGANIDMQYNDVRFFDVTPRTNSGGQDFFFRAGSSSFRTDVYQDGAGSGYSEIASPGGSITLRDVGTGVTLGLPAGATSNFILSDSRTVKTGSPLIFDADYSGNYTARSVVDKAYVDGVAGDGNGLISELPTASQTINGGANNLTINTANTAFATTASGGFTGPGGAVNDVTFVTVASSGSTIGYTDDSETKTMSVVIDQSSVAIGETTASVNVDVDGYFSKVQLASIPVTVPAEGKMFYNTTDNCTYISDGTDWKLHSGEQIASVHMAGGTNTSITAATAEQLNLTTSGTVTTLIADSQFTVQADGDIQYTGNNNAQLEISVSISTSTATATDMYYYLAINGTVQAGSRQRRDHANNDYGNIGLHFIDADADLNDVYSIYAEPVSGTVDITTSDAIIIVERTN